MANSKSAFSRFRKIPLQAVGIVLILFVASFLLWISNTNSNDAIASKSAKVYFDGEYRIGDGPWQEIIQGQHIPATKGDVTLRGNFHHLTPDGEYIGLYEEEIPIALYLDHINLTIYSGGNEPHITDNENPMYGFSMCGESWTAHSFAGSGSEPIEIVIHNPHDYGNETAVDQLLSNVAMWGDLSFGNNILSRGDQQRNIGLLFVIVSLILLGTALFSTLIHIKNNKIIWSLGLTVFFAGIYFVYSSDGISFWNESVVSNTILMQASVMFYLFFLSVSISYTLKGTKKVGSAAATALGAVDAGLFALPILTDIYFYDLLPFWILVQTIANVVLLVCLVKEFARTGNKTRWIYPGALLPLLGFQIDAAMTAFGYWKGGFISKYVFIILFSVAVVVILRIIPRSVNAVAKAKELEMEKNILAAELKESRVAIMLSQIQPHFIYNTLGTIERMCLKDPEKAKELVRNFSLYLRGNFSELDNTAPICFTEEIKHVKYYGIIEQTRFPDMVIDFDLQATEFVLPALSVQPLVENAIKHGLMRLESGGTVLVRSYENETHFCVEVIDNGAGFDVTAPIDAKKHVGLRNIRGRLKEMVGGELIVESALQKGTKATIKIPKEGTA